MRPSELYRIHDELAAWCFDRAVWLFGSELDAELRSAAHGAKNDGQARQRQQRVFAAYGISEVRYRDPAGTSKASNTQQEQPEVVGSTTAGRVQL